jgi:hypothetical protein
METCLCARRRWIRGNEQRDEMFAGTRGNTAGQLIQRHRRRIRQHTVTGEDNVQRGEWPLARAAHRATRRVVSMRWSMHRTRRSVAGRHRAMRCARDCVAAVLGAGRARLARRAPIDRREGGQRRHLAGEPDYCQQPQLSTKQRHGPSSSLIEINARRTIHRRTRRASRRCASFWKISLAIHRSADDSRKNLTTDRALELSQC